MVSLLLDGGADVNFQNSCGLTALMYAARNNNVVLLLNNGADIGIQGNGGYSALTALIVWSDSSYRMVSFLHDVISL